jgi:hypothetical protein
VKIEVLYFGGCPNHKPAVEQVRIALRFAGVDAPIEEVEVEDPAMAQKIGFLGSPSIRVDGLDVEPEARTLKEFSFSCRTYSSNGRRLGLPSIELIRKAVIEASISEALVESRGA